MNISEYKSSIKHLIETTTDESLLLQWKKQLEWDIEHQNELEFSAEEWELIKEGETDYKNGEVMSLEEFIRKRK